MNTRTNDTSSITINLDEIVNAKIENVEMKDTQHQQNSQREAENKKIKYYEKLAKTTLEIYGQFGESWLANVTKKVMVPLKKINKFYKLSENYNETREAGYSELASAVGAGAGFAAMLAAQGAGTLEVAYAVASPMLSPINVLTSTTLFYGGYATFREAPNIGKNINVGVAQLTDAFIQKYQLDHHIEQAREYIVNKIYICIDYASAYKSTINRSPTSTFEVSLPKKLVCEITKTQDGGRIGKCVIENFQYTAQNQQSISMQMASSTANAKTDHINLYLAMHNNQISTGIRLHERITLKTLQSLPPTYSSFEGIRATLNLPLTPEANHFLAQKVTELAENEIKSLNNGLNNLNALEKFRKERKDRPVIAKIKNEQTDLEEKLKSNLQKWPPTFTNQLFQLKATQKQINRAQQLLTNYGIKQERINKEVLDKISTVMAYIAKQEEKAKQEAILENNLTVFRGINAAFGVMGQIGHQFNLPELQKIATIGQSSVSLVINIGKLQGAFGFQAASGWTVLEPYSAIAMAGLSIFGAFFGQSGSGNGLSKELRTIMHQIQALHMEMRASFNQVFENQKRIYEAVFKSLDYLTVMMGDIKNIDSKLNRLEFIIFNSAKDIHSQSLINLIGSIRNDLNGIIPMGFKKKQETLGQLIIWLETHLKSSIQTGLIRDTGDPAKAIEILSAPEFDVNAQLPFFISHLERIAPQIKLAQKFDLINIPLFTYVTNFFIYTSIQYNFKQNNYFPVIERIKETLACSEKAINDIQENPIFMDNLFRHHKEFRYQIGRAIFKVMQEIPASVSNQMNLGSLLNKINPSTKQQFDVLINELEYRRLMLAHLCQLIGNPPDLKSKIDELDSKSKILNIPKEVFDKANEKMAKSSQGEYNIDDFEKAILNGANINHWNNGGQPLHHLGNYSNPYRTTPKMLHLLFKSARDLECGACSKYTASVFNYEITPIQFFGKNCFFQYVLLYSAAGFDVQESRAYLHDAYWWANANGPLGIIQKYLVRDMLNPNGILNRNDLRRAYQFYQTVEAGLPASTVGINVDCVLWLVAVLGDIKVLESLGSELKKLNVNKAIPICKFTPLMMAIHCGNESVVEYLLKAGAAINTTFETVEPHPGEIDDRKYNFGDLRDIRLKEPSHLLFLALGMEMNLNWYWQMFIKSTRDLRIAKRLIDAGERCTEIQKSFIESELAKEASLLVKESIKHNGICEAQALLRGSFAWLDCLVEFQKENLVFCNAKDGLMETKYPATSTSAPTFQYNQNQSYQNNNASEFKWMTHWYTDEQIDKILQHYYGNNNAEVEILFGMNIEQLSGTTFHANLQEQETDLQKAIRLSLGKFLRFMVVPVNLGLVPQDYGKDAGTHWASLVIWFKNPGNRESPSVFYCDSFGNTMPAALKNALKTVYKKFQDNDIYILSEKLQDDGYSCGAWMIETACYIIQHHKLPKVGDINIAQAKKEHYQIYSNLSPQSNRSNENNFQNKPVTSSDEKVPKIPDRSINQNSSSCTIPYSDRMMLGISKYSAAKTEMKIGNYKNAHTLFGEAKSHLKLSPELKLEGRDGVFIKNKLEKIKQKAKECISQLKM